MSATAELESAERRGGLVSQLENRILRQYTLQVADWQETCRELSAWEDEHLLDSPRSEVLAEHALMIANLERVGSWLLGPGQPNGADPALSGGIQATLQNLRDARTMWHGDVSPQRRAEILRT